MTRLRLGILLILVSWLPIAQVGIFIAHNHNDLTSADAANLFRLSIWAVQILIGFVGIWLAGKIAINAAKEEGWRKTPSKLWQLFIHNDQT